MLTPSALCALVIHALEDIKGQRIQSIPVAHLTSITDHMVICTATSSRHLQALANNVIKAVKAEGLQPYNHDYHHQTDWAVVDLGDVIVHIMREETRDYYAIEKLWLQQDTPEEA